MEQASLGEVFSKYPARAGGDLLFKAGGVSPVKLDFTRIIAGIIRA